MHDKIGRNFNSPETGDGPCVRCHMPSANHEWEIVELDTDGDIETINSQALCNTCHGSAMNPAALQAQKDQYADAVKFFGYYVDTANNYLGYILNSNSGVRNVNTTVDDYGAQQDYRYLLEDAGAFTHNSIYAKRILFDSIDLLDNGVFDGTITIPSSYAKARTWLNANSSGVATRP